jgi:hypothetical protein
VSGSATQSNSILWEIEFADLMVLSFLSFVLLNLFSFFML